MPTFYWLDMEMSGLDRERDKILEVAALVTDEQLSPRGEYEAVVYQPPEVLLAMEAWCQKTHKENGLTERVPHGKPIEQVENDLLALADAHCDAKERLILAGNSIYTDREFLVRGMPRFAARLHHRMLDVTAFKVIFQTRFNIFFRKKETHRAKDDVVESMAELAHYLGMIQPPAAPPASPAAG